MAAHLFSQLLQKRDQLHCQFFHQNDWGGEFGNYANSILVEQLKLADSGNLEMQDNKAFEEGAVYRFTIDVTNGNANADLKVEKIN